jgi:hypothetical protein
LPINQELSAFASLRIDLSSCNINFRERKALEDGPNKQVFVLGRPYKPSLKLGAWL